MRGFVCLVAIAMVALPLWGMESASITLGETNRESGLHLVGDRPGGDGLTRAAIVAGRPCRTNAPRKDGGMMLYFQVDDGFLAPGRHDCYVRVEYLDQDGDEWYLEYDSTDDSVRKVADLPGAFKTAGYVLKGESGSWRTVDFHLPDARFAGRCNGGDFRLNVGNPEDGNDYFASVAVYREQPPDYQPVQEAQMSMQPVSAGEGMEVILGATNFAPRAPREQIEGQFRDLRLDWFPRCGVTSWESYVRWSALEPEPGKWDFSVYDTEVELLQARGLKWVPFVIVGPSYATPDWFKAGPGNVCARCLEHGTDSAVQSIWNPNLPAQVDRVLAEFARHYGDKGVIESVLLGISGDFGEAIFPVSGGGWTGDYHQHGGYWCGDQYARDAFRRAIAGKYHTVAALNRAWGTSLSTLAAIDYPPVGEGGRPGKGLDMGKPGDRRRWLDFIEWYRGSMNDWVTFWMRTARKHFPQSRIYLCTGGDGHPTHGSDFTFQCKAAAEIRGGVRITNEGSDYTANLSLTRWVGTAGRHYGAYFTYEPASGVDANGLVVRIYNVAASGAAGLFEYSGNMTSAVGRRRQFRTYLPQLTAGKPVVPVAFLVPTSYLAMHPDEYWSTCFDRPRRFRDLFDYDLADEGLIRDGGLEHYRVLVAVGGNLLPEDVARRLQDWVKDGGTLVSADLGQVVTIEGKPIAEWPRAQAGKTSRRNLGKGALVGYGGKFDDPGYAEVLRGVVAAALKASGVPQPLDGVADGVHTTVRESDFLLLNTNDQAVQVAYPALGGAVEVPAHGMATVRRGKP